MPNKALSLPLSLSPAVVSGRWKLGSALYFIVFMREREREQNGSEKV